MKTPSRYVRRVMRGIRPDRESEEQYKERLTRMSGALQSMGTPMEEGTMEMLLAKASYDVMLYQASYASTEEGRFPAAGICGGNVRRRARQDRGPN